jgi:hypothetical protein
MMNHRKFFLSFFSVFICFSGMTLSAYSQSCDTLSTDTTALLRKQKITLNGYVKEMPSLSFDNVSDKPAFNNIVHNRINFRYRPSPELQFVVETRNRLLSGNMVKQLSGILPDMLEKDNGLFDASFVAYSHDNLIWHINSDRFYVDWQTGKWQLRMGRQRINWGINMVSNPNDLFNNYSFFDFDYEERPGADALRIQHFTGDLSRVELAVSPGKHIRQSVAAMLWAFNRKGYDFQLVAGYYHHRTALGAGWAGNIKSSGFKGEITLFNDIDLLDSMNVVAAVGIDHLFSNGLYCFAEVLYNGGHISNNNVFLLTEPMRADNIFISKYAATASLMYPVSPLLSVSLSGMYMPDIRAYYFLPNLRYSLMKNLDVSLLGQYFRFRDNTNFEQISMYLQAKWSF